MLWLFVKGDPGIERLDTGWPSSDDASAFLAGFSRHLRGCSWLSLAGILEATTSFWTTWVKENLKKQKPALTQNLARTSGSWKNNPAQHRNFSRRLCSDCFLWFSLKRSEREMVYTFLGAFAPCQALNKWFGISSPSLGGRCCGCTEFTDGKPEAQWGKLRAPGHTAEIRRLVFWV